MRSAGHWSQPGRLTATMTAAPGGQPLPLTHDSICPRLNLITRTGDPLRLKSGQSAAPELRYSPHTESHHVKAGGWRRCQTFKPGTGKIATRSTAKGNGNAASTFDGEKPSANFEAG